MKKSLGAAILLTLGLTWMATAAEPKYDLS
jgi:hypothetical protein